MINKLAGMKNTGTILYAALIFLCGCHASVRIEESAPDNDLSGTIQISGTSAMFPLAKQWAHEFERMHPGVKIEINTGGSEKGMDDLHSGRSDIAMIARALTTDEKHFATLKVVAADVVLPVVSAANPFRNILAVKGARTSVLQKIYLSETTIYWTELTGEKTSEAVKVYGRNDDQGISNCWKSFLECTGKTVHGTDVCDDSGMVSRLRSEPAALGYLSSAFLFDPATRRPYEGLYALAIDADNNGSIDTKEKFYSNLDQVKTAVNDHKFPPLLTRKLAFATMQRGHSPLIQTFLAWVSDGGQRMVDGAGYLSSR